MFEFVEFMYNLHNSWCGCNACDALKFSKPIKEYFDKDIPLELKKTFFVSHILNNRDVFKKYLHVLIGNTNIYFQTDD